jgi:hypothetical protein
VRREEDSESRGERQSERREGERRDSGRREERSEGRYRVRDIEKREIQ